MSAFNLTFQKLFGSSTNDNNCKTDLKLCPPQLEDKKKFHSRLPETVLFVSSTNSTVLQSEEKKFFFHSRSPETVLNSISFTFLSNWKTSDLHLVLEDL